MDIVEVLGKHFSISESRMLMFEMEIDQEDFPNTKNDFVREFYLYCVRHGKLEELLTLVQEKRPYIEVEPMPGKPRFANPQPINQPQLNPTPTEETANNSSEETHGMKNFLKQWELILAFFTIVGGIYLVFNQVRQSKINSTLEPFGYVVNVVDSGTGLPVVRADISLSLAGTAPFTGLTDDNGNKMLQVPAQFSGKDATLTIRADGYQPKTINLPAISDTSPIQEIQLLPLSK